MAATTAWRRPGTRGALLTGAVVVLVAAMALDTKVVRVGSGADTVAGEFVPAAFGKAEFPRVQAAVEARAVDAAVLAEALAKDPDAATQKYGLVTETGPELSVRFTGTAGKEELGVYDVSVPGLPPSVHISVQTGPAINGTSLRDGSGLVRFGQFHNQIEFQNAGAALNNAMKTEVLSRVDTARLAGKTISVVGVFDLSDPADWVVTPVRLDVK